MAGSNIPEPDAKAGTQVPPDSGTPPNIKNKSELASAEHKVVVSSKPAQIGGGGVAKAPPKFIIPQTNRMAVINLNFVLFNLMVIVVFLPRFLINRFFQYTLQC